jgi:hemolysin III
VYAVCLAGLFATSASYHRFARTEAVRQRLRRLDHAMIFLLIAGTYTPTCLLGLPRSWGVPLLLVVWVACLAGAALKLFSFDRCERLGRFMYVILGWAAVVALPVMLSTMPAPALVLLAAGGICFTAGAVVLARNSPNPAPATFGYHEVWHAFTIAGSACHFSMVVLLVTSSAVILR